ncbi:9442_t:CDS:1, partial [Diversispora eburnea]
ESHNYPNKSIIEYFELGRSYTYDIIKEGLYPSSTYLSYIKGENGYRIPDNYKVKTSWERSKTRQTVICAIKYLTKKSKYWIYYGNNFEFHVKSDMSCSDAAN